MPVHSALHKTILAGLCLLFAGCACLRPAGIDDVTTIETIQVPYVPPQHYSERELVLSDTLTFEAGGIDLTLIRDRERDTESGGIGIDVIAVSRPDTVFIPMPRETRTITRTVDRYRMPWWGWVIVGVLGLLALRGVIR